jgi:serine/threonine protein kinase
MHRNLERHRREAAVMERLGASPHVVDLFAYCGNTILTEFAPTDLSTTLGLEGHSRHPRKGSSTKKQNDPVDCSAEKGENSGDCELTVLQRLDLALQAAKAIRALHDVDVMHADLTAAQFLVLDSKDLLVDDQVHKTVLKLNDFNRCRFIPHKTNNGTISNEKCPVRIPTAPGLNRSPEEYAGRNLTQQIDIFSLGHVLFEIWTGTQSWSDVGGKRIRQQVQEGQLPPGVEKLLQANKDKAAPLQQSSLDQLMGRLIASCYKVDPAERITATELVAELEALIKLSLKNNQKAA